MKAKTVNAINFITLKNKKRVTSQRIVSFINKGALQLDCQELYVTILYVILKLIGKYTRKSQIKMHRFFKKNYFSMEAVSTDKNADITVNNTYSQSSVSFPPNLSPPLSPPLTLYGMENTS